MIPATWCSPCQEDSDITISLMHCSMPNALIKKNGRNGVALCTYSSEMSPGVSQYSSQTQESEDERGRVDDGVGSEPGVGAHWSGVARDRDPGWHQQEKRQHHKNG